MPHHKHVFGWLLGIVALAGIFVYIALRQARGITVEKKPVPLIAEQAVFIPTNETDPSLGNPGAPITVIEFIDFACEECLKLHQIIAAFAVEHPQKIRLVWKDAPQPGLFRQADLLPHYAAHCAHKQRKFWQFTDLLVKRKKHAIPVLQAVAREAQADEQTWWQCTGNSEEVRQQVAASLTLSQQLGIRALPAIFINNKYINMSDDFDLESMLQRLIAE